MKFRRWSIAIGICLLITAILAGVKTLQIRKAIAFAESFPEQSETVQAVSVKQTLWTPTVTAMGEVIALNSVELRNELGGKIVEVGFKPGATVRKGQLLLKLDTSEEEAQLTSAQAQLKLAQIDLNRFKKLIKTNASSKEQYDRALANLSNAKANAQVLKTIINKKTLRAPFDAATGLHELEPGQYLTADSVITRLVGTSPDVWIDFNLPQQQSMLAIGTAVTAKAQGLLTEPATGTVIARNSLVAAQSRNIRLRALFPDVANRLHPGVMVEVSVPTTQPQTVATLPTTAIRHDNFGSFVYVLVNDEQGDLRANKRKINVIHEHQQQAFVSEGLAPNERIAAIGSYKLRNGMLVNVKTDNSTPKPTADIAKQGGSHE